MKKSEPKFSLTVADRTYGLVSQFTVPHYLANDYCNNDCILTTPKGRIYISKTDYCFLCDRRFDEATRKSPLLCLDLRINRLLGYVGKVCCDCNYWLQVKEGYDAVPKSVKAFLDTGFTPVNITKYISL